MLKKYFEFIIIGLLILLFVQGFLNSPEGISEKEKDYLITINSLENDKTQLLKENSNLEAKINTFKDDYKKIDSVTNAYSNNQLDSFFTDFFNR
jgi:predicted nuclease with TOPRIM domain